MGRGARDYCDDPVILMERKGQGFILERDGIYKSVARKGLVVAT